MSSEAKKKVWKSAETGQYYITPPDLTWEDESELAAYTVSEEVAQAELNHALDDAVDQMQEAWHNLRAARPTPPPLDPEARERGRAIVEDLLDIVPEEVEADPSVAVDALKNMFAGFMTFVRSVTEEDGSVARQQMASLQAKLEKHDLISAETDLVELPNALQEAYQKTQEQRAAEFQNLAEQWDEAAADVSEALRNYAQEEQSNDTTDSN